MSSLTLNVFKCTNPDNTIHRSGHLCWLSQGPGGKNNMLIAKLALNTGNATISQQAASLSRASTIRIGLLAKDPNKNTRSQKWVEVDALDAVTALPGSDGEYISTGGFITMCPAVGSSLALRPSSIGPQSYDACVYLRLNTTSNHWNGSPLKLSFSLGSLECTTGPMMVMTKVKLDDEERCLAKLNSILAPLRARPPVLPAAKAAQLLAETEKVYEMACDLEQHGRKDKEKKSNHTAHRLAAHAATVAAAAVVAAVKLEQTDDTTDNKNGKKRQRSCSAVPHSTAETKKLRRECWVDEFDMMAQMPPDFEWVIPSLEETRVYNSNETIRCKSPSSISTYSNSSTGSEVNDLDNWRMGVLLEGDEEVEEGKTDRMFNMHARPLEPLAPVQRQNSLMLISDAMELSSSFIDSLPDVFLGDSFDDFEVNNNNSNNNDNTEIVRTPSLMWTSAIMSCSQTSCASH